MLELHGRRRLVDLLPTRPRAFEEVLFNLGLDEFTAWGEGFLGEDGGCGEASGGGGLRGPQTSPECEHHVGIANTLARLVEMVAHKTEMKCRNHVGSMISLHRVCGLCRLDPCRRVFGAP